MMTDNSAAPSGGSHKGHFALKKKGYGKAGQTEIARPGIRNYPPGTLGRQVDDARRQRLQLIDRQHIISDLIVLSTSDLKRN